MTDEPKKPEDRLTISVNKESRELFMTAGLRNRLAMHIQSPERIPLVLVDPIMQTILFCECLMPRRVSGAPADTEKKEYALEDFEMSTEDGERLGGWIAAHLIRFFMNGVLLTKETLEPHLARMVNLTSSLTGLADSLSKTASAGVSTAAQAKSA